MKINSLLVLALLLTPILAQAEHFSAQETEAIVQNALNNPNQAAQIAIENFHASTAIVDAFPKDQQYALQEEIAKLLRWHKFICKHADDNLFEHTLQTGCKPEDDNDNPARLNPPRPPSPS